MNDLKKRIEFTENGSWILNMSITNQQTWIAPGKTTSGQMGLRKKMEKVGRIVKLKQKNFSERNQTLKIKLSQKEPTEQNKKRQKNQPRTIICRLLNYKDKENILKSCRKPKGTNIFVNEDFSQEKVEHRRELWREVKRLREEEDKIA